MWQSFAAIGRETAEISRWIKKRKINSSKILDVVYSTPWGPPCMCCPLANATDLLTPVVWTVAGGWVKTTVLFFAFCGPKFTILRQRRERDRSLQLGFPIVDILFRSGDICDRSAKSSEIAPKIALFHEGANYHSAPGDFLPCKNSPLGEYLPEWLFALNIRRGDFFGGGAGRFYNGTPAAGWGR